MTQSGQGEESAVPAGGQPWGQPWGPESAPAPAPAPAAGADADATQYIQPMPGQGIPAAPPQPQMPPAQPAYAPQAAQPAQAPQAAQPGYAPQAAQPAYAPQVPPASQPPHAPQGAQAPQAPPAAQPAAQVPPQAPAAPAFNEAATQMFQPVVDGPGGGSGAAGPGQSLPAQGAPGALPPERDPEATYLFGAPGGTQGAHGGAPSAHGGAPSAHADASYGAPAGADAQATQYLPPVPSPQGPGAVPSGGDPYGAPAGGAGDRQPPAEFDRLFRSEPAGGAADSTQQMPRFEQPAPPPAQGHGGRAARRRAEDGYGNGGHPNGGYGNGGHPNGGYGDGGYGDDGYADDGYHGGRGGGGAPSRNRVLAVVGAGIVVVGLAAGGLIGLLGGDDDDKAGKDSEPAAASVSPTQESPSASPSADPAEAQAIELNKLLADSNNSRDAVVRSVESIKACENLEAAARDLRDAARQRKELVTRLSGLKTDKLPQNRKLRDSLNKAWQASASADNHYAAWADQVAQKKGCPKGKPKATNHLRAGNAASGEATEAKKTAAPLWNEIARKWDLSTRAPHQL
ncbi:hypothetical protein [Streptomyces sp. KLOTTS4A1]|uniref:hypothetical protein n=1 Tax=Streptomyces sp. KLOTTS4A1 TaxID=3390996 RepID=UPI0039F4D924